MAEHAVFCMMSFIPSALYGESCTASGYFRGIGDPCRSDILPPLSQRILDLVQDVGLFEIVRGRTFDIRQAYLAFHWIAEVDWAREDNVEWLPYNPGGGIVSEILARVVIGRERTLQDEVTSRQFIAVKIRFLVDQLFYLPVTHEGSWKLYVPAEVLKILLK